MTAYGSVSTHPDIDIVVTRGHRVAAGLTFVTAVGLVIGSILAVSALATYQLVINIGIAVLLGYGGLLLLRGHQHARGLTVALTWIAAIAVTAESGGHQDRMNDTGQLGASNTEYFLPGLVWLAIGVLFAVAVAVMALTKRARGT